MTGVSLAVLVLGLLTLAAGLGLIAMLVGNLGQMEHRVTFGWGAVLGPVGVLVVLVVALRRRQSGHAEMEPF